MSSHCVPTLAARFWGLIRISCCHKAGRKSSKRNASLRKESSLLLQHSPGKSGVAPGILERPGCLGGRGILIHDCSSIPRSSLKLRAAVAHIPAHSKCFPSSAACAGAKRSQAPAEEAPLARRVPLCIPCPGTAPGSCKSCSGDIPTHPRDCQNKVPP